MNVVIVPWAVLLVVEGTGRGLLECFLLNI